MKCIIHVENILWTERNQILYQHLSHDHVQGEPLRTHTILLCKTNQQNDEHTFDFTTFFKSFPNVIILGIEWEISNENTTFCIVLEEISMIFNE